MSQFPTLWQTFKKETLSIYSLVEILIISFIYFSFSTLLLNYKLVLSSIFSESSLRFKFTILFQLLIGSYSAFDRLDFFLLIITSLLVGTNILMVYKTLKSLRGEGGKLTVAAGGKAVFGIFFVGLFFC